MPQSLELETCNFSHHLSHTATSGYLIHSHDCYELYYIVEGDLCFLYDGAEYTLKPHTLILIASRVLHGIHVRSGAPYDRYTFHFVPAFFPRETQRNMVNMLPSLQTLRSGTSPFPFLIEHADRYGVVPALDEILALSERDRASQLFFAPILLQSLLMRIYLQSTSASVRLPTLSAEDPPELAPVLDYIRRHPGNRITLDDLSERFYVSRSQLNKLFRKHYDMSVMSYVSGQKLSYAQKLLLSGISAAEAASVTGYADYSTFYRAYTKQFGHPPNEDRAAILPETAQALTGVPDFGPSSLPVETLNALNIPAEPVFPDISFENNAYEPLDK